MKKLFILAAAIVAFASCSKNEEPTAMVPTREIQFATAAQTRADMTVVDVKYLQDNGFAVYGYAANEAIFTKTEVLYDNGDCIRLKKAPFRKHIRNNHGRRLCKI